MSDANQTGVLVLVPPAKMKKVKPIPFSHTTTSVELKWPALAGNWTGGTPITAYTLMWDKGTALNEYEPVSEELLT